jgi:cold shock CspA family protein
VSTIEYGIVKFFKDDKKFGFVTVLDANGDPTSTELFFHYNNGHFLREGTSEPDFRYETGTMVDGRVKHIKEPQKGDKVVFVRGSSAKGDKVAKWGSAAQYDSIIECIANRPVYRLVRSGSNYGQDASGIVWQGQDISDLSAEHPKYLRYGKVCDSIEAGSADSGDMYWHFSIERQLPDGSWKSCNDPRVFLCCLPRHIQNAVANRGGRELSYDRRCRHQS